MLEIYQISNETSFARGIFQQRELHCAGCSCRLEIGEIRFDMLNNDRNRRLVEGIFCKKLANSLKPGF